MSDEQDPTPPQGQQGDDPLAGYDPNWRKKAKAPGAPAVAIAPSDDPLAGYDPNWKAKTGDVDLSQPGPGAPTPAAPIRMPPVLVKPSAAPAPREVITAGPVTPVGVPQSEVDRLGFGTFTNDPHLSHRIANRLGALKGPDGYRSDPAPLTFGELAAHVVANGAASMVGLGHIADADDERKMEAWARNGGDMGEVLVPATAPGFDPVQLRHTPGTPAITRADVLGMLSAGGALAGAEGVGKALGPLGDLVGTSEATGAGVRAGIRDAASANEVGGATATRGGRLLKGLRDRVPVMKEAAVSGVAQGAVGGALGAVDDLTSGERDPRTIAKDVLGGAAQFGLLGGASHMLAGEGAFRVGKDVAGQQLDAMGVRDRLAAERMARTPEAERAPSVDVSDGTSVVRTGEPPMRGERPTSAPAPSGPAGEHAASAMYRAGTDAIRPQTVPAPASPTAREGTDQIARDAAARRAQGKDADLTPTLAEVDAKLADLKQKQSETTDENRLGHLASRVRMLESQRRVLTGEPEPEVATADKARAAKAAGVRSLDEAPTEAPKETPAEPAPAKRLEKPAQKESVSSNETPAAADDSGLSPELKAAAPVLRRHLEAIDRAETSLENIALPEKTRKTIEKARLDAVSDYQSGMRQVRERFGPAAEAQLHAHLTVGFQPKPEATAPAKDAPAAEPTLQMGDVLEHVNALREQEKQTPKSTTTFAAGDRVRTKGGGLATVEKPGEQSVTIRHDSGGSSTSMVPPGMLELVERAPAPASASDEVAASSAPAQAEAPTPFEKGARVRSKTGSAGTVTSDRGAHVTVDWDGRGVQTIDRTHLTAITPDAEAPAPKRLTKPSPMEKVPPGGFTEADRVPAEPAKRIAKFAQDNLDAIAAIDSEPAKLHEGSARGEKLRKRRATLVSQLGAFKSSGVVAPPMPAEPVVSEAAPAKQLTKPKSQYAAGSPTLERARELGAAHFAHGGKSAPATDPAMMPLLKQHREEGGKANELLDAWANGYHAANLAAPVDAAPAKPAEKTADWSSVSDRDSLARSLEGAVATRNRAIASGDAATAEEYQTQGQAIVDRLAELPTLRAGGIPITSANVRRAREAFDNKPTAPAKTLKRTVTPATPNEVGMSRLGAAEAQRELTRHEDMLDDGLSTAEETKQAKRIVAILKQRVAELASAEPTKPSVAQPGAVTVAIRTPSDNAGHTGAFVDHVAEAKDATGKVVGFVDYEVDGSHIDIRHVEVEPAWRRKGIATKLYDAIHTKHPGATLRNGDLTADGQAFRERYDQRHAPKPAEPGLAFPKNRPATVAPAGASIPPKFDTPVIRSLREQANAVPVPENTPERIQWRVGQAEALAQTATRFERRADLVLGLPGAGKSSVATNPLVEGHGGANLDADVPKQNAPEYQNGIGAKALLAESSAIRQRALELAVGQGANLVYPTIGHPTDTPDLVRALQAQGYAVHVHMVDVPPEVAAERSTDGFLKGGRHFVDPADTLHIGDRPRRAYAALAGLPGVTAHDPIDNDVPHGSAPRAVANWRDEWQLGGAGVSEDADDAAGGRSGRGRRSGEDAAADAPESEVANGPATRPIRGSDLDGAPLRGGAPTVDAGASPRPVPRDGAGGDAGSALPAGRGERGAPVRRPDGAGDHAGADGDGVRSAPGDAGRRPDGSGRSGDAGARARAGEDDGAVAPPVTAATATAPRSATPATGTYATDFRITPETDLAVGGPRARIKQNIAAILLARTLAADGRVATRAEQEVLAKYVGWGDSRLSKLFDDFSDTQNEWAVERGQLQAILTPAEYRAASASTKNAHYTSPEVIRAVYDALDHLGVRPGVGTLRMLEPAAGIGHFLGLLPEGIQRQATLVELDPTTASIAKALYPSADVRASGIEKTKLPRDAFDLIVGNPPFGSYQVADPEYDKHKLLIHDYFFVKALDHLRPGGVLAFVTSNGTMDKRDSSARKMMAARADLLGAVRLPNTAFKGNAGTDVVTDVLFFQKPVPGATREIRAWMTSAPLEVEGGEGFHVNEYYLAHPENVLGDHSAKGSMYRGGSYTVSPRDGLKTGEQLDQAMRSALRATLPANIYSDAGSEPAPLTSDDWRGVQAPPGLRDGWMHEAEDGTLVRNRNGFLEPAPVAKAAIAKVKKLIALREAVVQLRAIQMDAGRSEREFTRSLRETNRLYDAFVKVHGPINLQKVSEGVYQSGPNMGRPYRTIRRPNLDPFKADPSYPMVMAMEDFDPVTNTAAKADMLKHRILAPPVEVTHVDSPTDAVGPTLNKLGRLDVPHMAQLAGVTEEEIADALRGTIAFEDPATGRWTLADDYLSGNVKEKLARATAAAESDPARYRDNVAALTKVIPTDLPPSEIAVKLGSPWVPVQEYSAFASETFGGRVTVHFIAAGGGAFRVEASHQAKSSAVNTTEYGTNKADGLRIFADSLNLRATEITWRDQDGKTHKDPEASIAAQAKQDLLKQRFREWVWEAPERATSLAALYNRTFNHSVAPDVKGQFLVVQGTATHVRGRPFEWSWWQLDAIWRMVTRGNTLLAHVVGAGKTFEMIAAGMEMKRLGLARKPLYTVPNHMLEQFSREFLQLYPNANVLVATKKDFAKARRREFTARMASHDWDAIIMTHSSFELIGISAERQRAFIDRELDALEDMIRSAKADKSERQIVKVLEAAKSKLEVKLERLLKAEKKDDLLSFEETGVDQLFVDEAHMFKNLAITSKMRGMATTGAERSFDMLMKTQYLQERTPGRGVVFATGTPISNSMAEAFTMQRYLQPQALADAGIMDFDAWAATFGESVLQSELAPDGSGYRSKERFSQFQNIPELVTMYRQVADIKLAGDIFAPPADGERQKRPRILNAGEPILATKSAARTLKKGGNATVALGDEGKPLMVLPPASMALNGVVRSLVHRAERVKGKQVDPSEDNFLKITTEGRLAAMDLRLISPFGFADPDGKITKAADAIARIFEETKSVRGTQLVFSDIGTPKKEKTAKVIVDDEEGSAPSSAPDDGDDEPGLGGEGMGVPGFNVYDELRGLLVARGIPAAQVKFIHEAKNDEQKQKLIDDVKAGRVRVLIGSTEKMGAGMNAQDRLVWLHHLDAPWRPSDIEQREGRIVRQGNKLWDDGLINGVGISRYGTEGSFDAYMWQTLERKAGSFGPILKGESKQRTMAELDSRAMDLADMKAATSGNPLVKEKNEVDVAVHKLAINRAQHRDSQIRVRAELASLAARLSAARDYLAGSIVDAAKAAETDLSGKHFTITLGKKVLDDRGEADERLSKLITAALEAGLGSAKQAVLGDLGGFRVLIVQAGTTWNPERKEMEPEFALALDGAKQLYFGRRFRAADPVTHGVATIENQYRRIPEGPRAYGQDVEDLSRQQESYKQQIGKPFPDEARLTELETRQAELAKSLSVEDAKNKEEPTLEEGSPAWWHALKTGVWPYRKVVTAAAVTQTPAFKAWFADSKVVDESGAPLIVYHGTRAPKFDTFKMGSAVGWGAGIYFTDNEAQAREEFGDGPTGHVVPAYVAIQKPYRGEGIPEGVEQTAAWKTASAKWPDVADAWQEDSKFVGAALRELGYDGIIAEGSNSIEGREIVAFSPNQVKHATENSGEFDGGNPNMMMGFADPITAVYHMIREVARLSKARKARELRRSQPERVRAAAVRLPSGKVVEGVNHQQALEKAVRAGLVSASWHPNYDFNDGWSTTHRPFVNREQGYAIAARAEQNRGGQSGELTHDGFAGGGRQSRAYGFADPITATVAALAKTASGQAAVAKTVDWTKAANRALQATFNASNVTPEAGRASRVIRQHRAQMDREIEQAHTLLAETRAALDKLAPGANYDGPRWKWYFAMEQGDFAAIPHELVDVSNAVRKIQDDVADEIRALGPGHLDAMIEHYMARVYKEGPKIKGTPASALGRALSARPIDGRKAFKKERGYRDSMQDALDDGYVPISDNPLDMVLIKIREMRRYLMAHRIKNELKGPTGQSKAAKAARAAALVRWKPASRAMPDGYAAINDNAFTVFAQRGADGATRIRGQYVAPVEVANVINNFLSPGLRGKVWYDAYAGLGNVINMVQLGLSAFHAGFVAFDATVQMAATGLDQVLTGKGPGGRLAGGKKLLIAGASAATGPFTGLPLPAAIMSYLDGRKVWHAYMHDAPTQEMAQVIDGLVAGGGRAKMDDYYRSNAIKRTRDAFRDKRWLATVWNAPFAALESTMHPLLEHVVPRMKMGAIYHMMQVELAKLPSTATDDEVRKAAARVVDAVDARLGQMIYDNRFWHRATKEMMMAGIRSVGWNVGTFDVTLGSAAQLGGNLLDVGHGRTPEAWHKVQYLIMLAGIVALYGAIFTYLHTGEVPKGWKDAYFPRTGKKDKTGNEERATLPTYMKDIFALRRHPLTTVAHKTHPLINAAIEMVSNKNFYGDEIVNADDPLMKQAQDQAKFVMTDVLQPFTFRNVAELKKRGEGAREMAEGFIGIQAAPREMVRSEAQNKMAEYLARRGHPMRTPTERDASEARQDITDGLRDGTVKRDSLRLLVRSGDLTRGQATRAAVASRENPLVTRFKMLAPAEAQRVYDLGTDDEKALWEKPLRLKMRRLRRPSELASAPD